MAASELQQQTPAAFISTTDNDARQTWLSHASQQHVENQGRPDGKPTKGADDVEEMARVEAESEETPQLPEGKRPVSGGSATVENPGILAFIGSSIPTPAFLSRLSRKDSSPKNAGDDNISSTGQEASSQTVDAPRPTPQRQPSSSSPVLDHPLSQHIFERSYTDRSTASKRRNFLGQGGTEGNTTSAGNINQTNDQKAVEVANEEQPPQTVDPKPLPDTQVNNKQQQPKDKDKEKAREKKSKRVSFLNRLSMRTGNKKDVTDTESEVSELPSRAEGPVSHGVAFSSDAGLYIPRHREPPRPTRVKAHNKKSKEFEHTFLAQELVGTRTQNHGSGGGPIWAAKFSRDGKYLATGGKDRIVRVWAVIDTPEDRKSCEEAETDQQQKDSNGHANSNNKEAPLSAPVFHPTPHCEFSGHEGDILDLTWSKNNFLISSAMDKTVRLWHPSRADCLCTFGHKDFVTSIAFHPLDDRFFLAGCLDSTLKLWSIPDKHVAYSHKLNDIVTAVAFTPDGKTAIAGGFGGICTFHDTEGLTCQTQLHVRSTRGKNSKGSKITGISTMEVPVDGGEIKVLITTNDSRIRVYRLTDKSLVAKLKGHTNAANQISAKFNDDGKYIICGSEDRRTYIWSSELDDGTNPVKDDKRPYEYFDVSRTDMVTEAFFAPMETRQLLQASEDPIYTLCNPPAITLVSKDETQSVHSKDSGKAASSTPSAVPTTPKSPFPPIDQSPAFHTRSSHPGGNIIITTDHSGAIKVFRQDCAYSKRRQALENWETGSVFSKKLNGGNGSVRTRTRTNSMASKDPRNSTSMQSVGNSNGHLPVMHPSNLGDEQINEWREGVGNGSPTKRPRGLTSTTNSSTNSNNKKAMDNAADDDDATPTVPPTPGFFLKIAEGKKGASKDEEDDDGDQTPRPEDPKKSKKNIVKGDEVEVELGLDPAGASYSFWNLSRWRGSAVQQPQTISEENGAADNKNSSPSNKKQQHSRSRSEGGWLSKRKSTMGMAGAEADEQEKLPPVPAISVDGGERRAGSLDAGDSSAGNGLLTVPGTPGLNGGRSSPTGKGGFLTRLRSGASDVSRLTVEVEGDETGEGDEDGKGGLRCEKCQGREFKAKKVGGKERLLCSGCGRMVEDC